jgi:hypothetical protein
VQTRAFSPAQNAMPTLIDYFWHWPPVIFLRNNGGEAATPFFLCTPQDGFGVLKLNRCYFGRPCCACDPHFSGLRPDCGRLSLWNVYYANCFVAEKQ